AQERMCAILLAGAGAAPEYGPALEGELRRRADALFANRQQEVPRLVRCLRQTVAARPHFSFALGSADARVREIGRGLVLPDLGEALAGETWAALAIRSKRDQVCPAHFIEEKIQLCLRLPQVGVDATAVDACYQQLQEERPVACPRCGSLVPRGHLDAHLRRVHRIWQF